MSTATITNAELSSQLRVPVMRLARRLRNQRSEVDLSLTQLAALGTLSRHGALTPGELAAHERVRPPSMTRIVAGLEERGLVQRTPHPSDGRQVLVTLTSEAKALIREDRRRRDAWLAQQLAQLSPAERDVLLAAAPLLEQLAVA
jgi:DNA-binding MarR family transcriptional regulator